MSGHGVSFEVVERDDRDIATAWLATCGRHGKFVGASYEETEDKWRQHVYEVTGIAPNPMGNKEGRWTP